MSRYHRYQHSKKHRVLVAKRQAKAKFVDRLTFAAAVIEPIITLPQVYVIFHERTAAGVSISAWVGYEVLTMVWLWYGLTHKDKIITLYSSLFAVVQLGIIVGALMYGGRF